MYLLALAISRVSLSITIARSKLKGMTDDLTNSNLVLLFPKRNLSYVVQYAGIKIDREGH